jgi:hypothetical protein
VTDRWSKAWRVRAAQSTTRSRRSRHREASRDLGKARAALGTRAGGTGCRGSAMAGMRRAAQPGRQNTRHAGGALERGCAAFQPVNASSTGFFSKMLNRSAQSGE